MAFCLRCSYFMSVLCILSTKKKKGLFSVGLENDLSHLRHCQMTNSLKSENLFHCLYKYLLLQGMFSHFKLTLKTKKPNERLQHGRSGYFRCVTHTNVSTFCTSGWFGVLCIHIYHINIPFQPWCKVFEDFCLCLFVGRQVLADDGVQKVCYLNIFCV